jgi:uncharacterized protein (UPF0276 family)
MRPLCDRGAGFNPAFVHGPLALPEGCARLEAGASLCDDAARAADLAARAGHLSLHLARAPFCEGDGAQDAFVEHLARRLVPAVASVGLHLSGPYNDNLGRFGLGTGYVRGRDHDRACARLLGRLRRLDRPVLLENASFYHDTAAGLCDLLRFTNRVAADHGASLIVDLAHLAMNAHNLRLAPEVLLGAVDWSLVAVIHVSGVTEDRRGVWHDGHDKPVHDAVWSLLDVALPLCARPVTAVLEHTDPSWAARGEALRADWRRLGEALDRAAAAPPPPPVDVDAAGVGYMAQVVLPQAFPALREALTAGAWRALVGAWAGDYLARTPEGPGPYAFLRPSDRFAPGAPHRAPLDDFERFALDALAEAAS